ncbi:MAG TPA: glycosyltransferase family 39 protein, partial [Chloroflexota bacterium]|nr:glycosyltransferase family 39 protein [Chloroflexota bacterium]
PDAFDAPFIVTHEGRWFGKYPPGFPALLSLGVLADLPWLMNPLLSALAVTLVYRAGRRLYGQATAAVAALLAATSPFLALQAGSMLSHVAGLVWAMLLLLGFESARRRDSALAALGAGAALGGLFLTRPLTAVAIGTPYLAWSLMAAARGRGRWRLPASMAAGAVPFVLAFLTYNNATTGHPLRTGYELWWPYDWIGFGAGMGNMGGHTPAMGMLNSYQNIWDLAFYLFLFGWPWGLSLVPAGLALSWALFEWAAAWWKARGLWGAGRLRRVAPPNEPARWDLLNGAVVACLVAGYAAYWTTGACTVPATTSRRWAPWRC